MARRSGRSASGRFPGFNRARLLLFLVLAVLIAVSTLPRFAPALRQGPQCTDLAAPIGGNNRSLLAQAGDDPQELNLELRLASRVVATDQTLEVQLTFANSDTGPVILYLTDATPPLTRLDNDAGVSFEIGASELTSSSRTMPDRVARRSHTRTNSCTCLARTPAARKPIAIRCSS